MNVPGTNNFFKLFLQPGTVRGTLSSHLSDFYNWGAESCHVNFFYSHESHGIKT